MGEEHYDLHVILDKDLKIEYQETIKKFISCIKGVIEVKNQQTHIKEKANIEAKPTKSIDSTTNFFTVKQMAKRHPAFSEASLRHLVFFAMNNNFEQCVKRVGRKVLILEDEFLKWVSTNPTLKIVHKSWDLKKYGK